MSNPREIHLVGESVEALERLVSYVLDTEGDDTQVAELAEVLADELASQ